MEKSQLRAARALLGWSQDELGIRAGVSLTTLKRIEAGDGEIKASDDVISKIEAAIRGAGIEFIYGDPKIPGSGIGVLLTKTNEKARITFILERLREAEASLRRAVTVTRTTQEAEEISAIIAPVAALANAYETSLGYESEFDGITADGTSDGI